MLQHYISLGSILCCDKVSAYGLVRFRQKKHLVRVGKKKQIAVWPKTSVLVVTITDGDKLGVL